MLLTQVLSIMGFACYAASLTLIQTEWHLSHFESGFLASSFFLGYVAIVPLATTLTDKIDTRQIYLSGGIAAGLGLFGMGFLASGFHDAWIYLMLHGAGISATYMPGLKIISDRVKIGEVTRHISFYTAFFGIGAASSYFISGLLIESHGWRYAFMVTSIGPTLAGILAWVGTQKLPHEKSLWDVHFEMSDIFPLQRWKKVLAVKEATGYMLGYAAHSLELFASRSWLVAFFTYCATVASPDNAFPMTATVIATMINLIGVPASIVGNEMALRIGRHRWVYWIMIGSAISGIALGAAVHMHWSILLILALLHSIFIMADSATLTAGLVISVPQDIKGSAMGLHSVLGFGGGLLGPAIFGAVLDITRLLHSDSWIPAYASIVVWGLLFIFYTQFSVWKTRRSHQS
ncbi:MAG: MFS transporter [Polynucleobacter sp.]|nr:MAG: MFS transporter [Polynucleobacter sp.]